MTHEEARRRMMEEQIKSRGIDDARVLGAFSRVPRHLFVPAEHQSDAYADRPLPIGHEQTISQPYIVALMVDALRLHGHERVLEIGSGSGYQLAILSELSLEVYAVERIPALADIAARRLHELGCANVHLSTGNGMLGWREHAPYDAIVVSAAAAEVPLPLIEQLGDPGRLVIPLGSAKSQTLTLIERRNRQFTRRAITQCVFVPLIGAEGAPEA